MSVFFEPMLDVLPPVQQRLWPELREVPKRFVLYGGTAIALRFVSQVKSIPELTRASEHIAG